MLGFCPDFFRFWLDFSSHSDTLNQCKWWKRCKIDANFVKKICLFFFLTHNCVRSWQHKWDAQRFVFLNGSETSGKLRYRDSQRPMRGKAHAGKTSYAYSCVHAHMRTCVYAYVRTQARMYARTHCTCIAHMSARMIFFPSVSLSMHRSTSRDTVASRMSRGTAVYRLLLIHRLLLILFARMSVRLTCAVTHVCTYEYAYWAFPAWTFPRIGLYESPPLYFKKWFKAFITATDSHSMAVRKSSLAPLLTSRVTALLQSK